MSIDDSNSSQWIARWSLRECEQLAQIDAPAVRITAVRATGAQVSSGLLVAAGADGHIRILREGISPEAPGSSPTWAERLSLALPLGRVDNLLACISPLGNMLTIYALGRKPTDTAAAVSIFQLDFDLVENSPHDGFREIRANNANWSLPSWLASGPVGGPLGSAPWLKPIPPGSLQFEPPPELARSATTSILQTVWCENWLAWLLDNGEVAFAFEPQESREANTSLFRVALPSSPVAAIPLSRDRLLVAGRNRWLSLINAAKASALEAGRAPLCKRRLPYDATAIIQEPSADQSAISSEEQPFIVALANGTLWRYRVESAEAAKQRQQSERENFIGSLRESTQLDTHDRRPWAPFFRAVTGKLAGLTHQLRTRKLWSLALYYLDNKLDELWSKIESEQMKTEQAKEVSAYAKQYCARLGRLLASPISERSGAEVVQRLGRVARKKTDRRSESENRKQGALDILGAIRDAGVQRQLPGHTCIERDTSFTIRLARATLTWLGHRQEEFPLAGEPVVLADVPTDNAITDLTITAQDATRWLWVATRQGLSIGELSDVACSELKGCPTPGTQSGPAVKQLVPIHLAREDSLVLVVAEAGAAYLIASATEPTLERLDLIPGAEIVAGLDLGPARTSGCNNTSGGPEGLVGLVVEQRNQVLLKLWRVRRTTEEERRLKPNQLLWVQPFGNDAGVFALPGDLGMAERAASCAAAYRHSDGHIWVAVGSGLRPRVFLYELVPKGNAAVICAQGRLRVESPPRSVRFAPRVSASRSGSAGPGSIVVGVATQAGFVHQSAVDGVPEWTVRSHGACICLAGPPNALAWPGLGTHDGGSGNLAEVQWLVTADPCHLVALDAQGRTLWHGDLGETLVAAEWDCSSHGKTRGEYRTVAATGTGLVFGVPVTIENANIGHPGPSFAPRFAEMRRAGLRSGSIRGAAQSPWLEHWRERSVLAEWGRVSEVGLLDWLRELGGRVGNEMSEPSRSANAAFMLRALSANAGSFEDLSNARDALKPESNIRLMEDVWVQTELARLWWKIVESQPTASANLWLTAIRCLPHLKINEAKRLPMVAQVWPTGGQLWLLAFPEARSHREWLLDWRRLAAEGKPWSGSAPQGHNHPGAASIYEWITAASETFSDSQQGARGQSRAPGLVEAVREFSRAQLSFRTNPIPTFPALGELLSRVQTPMPDASAPLEEQAAWIRHALGRLAAPIATQPQALAEELRRIAIEQLEGALCEVEDSLRLRINVVHVSRPEPTLARLTIDVAPDGWGARWRATLRIYKADEVAQSTTPFVERSYERLSDETEPEHVTFTVDCDRETKSIQLRALLTWPHQSALAARLDTFDVLLPPAPSEGPRGLRNALRPHIQWLSQQVLSEPGGVVVVSCGDTGGHDALVGELGTRPEVRVLVLTSSLPALESGGVGELIEQVSAALQDLRNLAKKGQSTSHREQPSAGAAHAPCVVIQWNATVDLLTTANRWNLVWPFWDYLRRRLRDLSPPAVAILAPPVSAGFAFRALGSEARWLSTHSVHSPSGAPRNPQAWEELKHWIGAQFASDVPNWLGQFQGDIRQIERFIRRGRHGSGGRAGGSISESKRIELLREILKEDLAALWPDEALAWLVWMGERRDTAVPSRLRPWVVERKSVERVWLRSGFAELNQSGAEQHAAPRRLSPNKFLAEVAGDAPTPEIDSDVEAIDWLSMTLWSARGGGHLIDAVSLRGLAVFFEHHGTLGGLSKRLTGQPDRMQMIKAICGLWSARDPRAAAAPMAQLAEWVSPYVRKALQGADTAPRVTVGRKPYELLLVWAPPAGGPGSERVAAIQAGKSSVPVAVLGPGVERGFRALPHTRAANIDDMMVRKMCSEADPSSYFWREVRSQLGARSLLPFITRGPVDQGSPALAPRQPLIDALVHALDTTSVVVLGPRQSGKTTLLHALRHAFADRDDVQVAWLDAQGTDRCDVVERAWAFEAEAPRPAANAWAEEVGPLHAAALFARKQGKRLLVLVNEIDRLCYHDPEGLRRWRALHDAGLARFAFVGHAQVLPTLSDPLHPLYNFAAGIGGDKFTLVGLLSADEAAPLLDCLEQEPLFLGWSNSNDREQGRRMIFRRARGVAWLIQAYCSEVAVRVTEARRSRISLDDVRAVIGGDTRLRDHLAETDLLAISPSMSDALKNLDGGTSLLRAALLAVANEGYPEDRIRALASGDQRAYKEATYDFTVDELVSLIQTAIQSTPNGRATAERLKQLPWAQWLKQLPWAQWLDALTVTLYLRPSASVGAPLGNRGRRYAFLGHIFPLEEVGETCNETLEGCLQRELNMWISR